MPHITANEISIYYERKGEGQPVLFIGGTGADLRARPNILDGSVPDRFDLVAYDQRGLGRTDKPLSDYVMADYADDAAALILALGWQKAHIIGVSFGGMVALQLACRHPELIDRLVLCCSSPGGSLGSFPFHDLPLDLSIEDRTTRLMGVNDTRRDKAWQDANPQLIQKTVQYMQEHKIADHELPEYKAGARRQLLARKDHDVKDALGSILHETLICAGKYDGIAPVENQEFMAQEIKRSELRWYEGGHLFMVQDKTASKDIIEWLAS